MRQNALEVTGFSKYRVVHSRPFPRRIVLIFTCLLILVLAGGCPQAKRHPAVTVGVMFRVASNPYFEAMEHSLRDTAEKERIHLLTVQGDRLKDSKEQNEDIFREIMKAPLQALLIVPENDDRARTLCIPHILEANRRGIPVIFLHSEISRSVLAARGASVLCLVACNNRQGGVLAGGYIAKKMNGTGKVLIVGDSGNTYTARNRREGCREALSRYPSITMIESPHPGWDRQKSFTISTAMLQQHPDIKGVFAFSDPIAMGVMDAVTLTRVNKPVIVENRSPIIILRKQD